MMILSVDMPTEALEQLVHCEVGIVPQSAGLVQSHWSDESQMNLVAGKVLQWCCIIIFLITV